MKKIKSSKGKQSLYPRLIYCYKSVIESLQEMVSKPGFIDKYELWRERNIPQGVYADVFDGKVWNDFMSVDGLPFLAAPFNYALHLNVDRFQPFKHTQHSEGAIYLSVLNLPRQDRFLKENVILVGVTPGPKEPELHMNSFLQPLVSDLTKLWEGVCMKTANNVSIMVRAGLLCVGCDIPAARKVCGFLGHRATMGCSKCLLPFPTVKFGEKADYSNFDRTEWKQRTNDHHRSQAMKCRSCVTKSDRIEIERASGVRYSCLLELPYFNAPRMCIIDPMHNLLLGTSKMMVEIWKTSGILSVKDFAVIQLRVDSFVCPSEVARVPSKISSSFSGFTAEQWKNWTIYFSPYALKGILQFNHYNCWLLFVKACWLLCRRNITVAELKDGDDVMLEFSKRFVQLYGPTMCTMNMHLHGHIKECIEDFGPVYSFWCFSFEQLNGVLGSYHTNNHHISVQLMRRFLDSKLYAPEKWPSEFVEEYLTLLKGFDYNKGPLTQTTLNRDPSINDNLDVGPLPFVSECAFLPLELNDLQKLVNSGVDGSPYQVYLLHRRCNAVMLKSQNHEGHVLGAKNSRHSRSCLVLCRHVDRDDTGLASILFFAECITKNSNNGQQNGLWVAAVSWYMPHDCFVWFGKPTQVWATATFPGYSFVPVGNIKSRVLYTQAEVNFGRIIGLDTVNIVVPLNM